ncbi:unnamed protein product [Prunus armeniaca]|uniref:Uncharacterized protein n=1 Tax=Prunus armeniaca TaxID=36596 RepID=A0A6J5WA43_PRUAR|nr:unnamed protein product [Prunus armeniaca]
MSTETTQVPGEPKKLGHTISKGHKNCDLMLNLQLGIRYCIGKHASIVRDLKPMLLLKESVTSHNFHKGFMKFLCPTHSGFGWRCSGQWFGARTKFFGLNWLMLLNLGRVHKDIRIWVAFESDS